MKRRYPQKKNVLLVNITRLGDMLQATPTIAGIKRENPDCKVTVLVEKQFEEVCHHLPNIDDVVSVDLGMTVRCLVREQDGIVDAFEYITDLINDLRARNFDYCLNMSSSAYTALLLRLIGIERNGGWTSDEEGYRVIESEWAKLFATSVFHSNRQFNSLNLVDVFRCSADVEQHPHSLLMKIDEKDTEYAQKLIAEAGFGGDGPFICIQAGASQEKRQWLPEKFIKLIHILTERLNARIALIGSKKELPIINMIKAGCPSNNVAVFAGRTNIPQLSAVVKEAKVLVTGDTGPMHIAVAAGTPVVAMFLASAYGFETGPYGEGHIVLQPVISCGPCNPNKPCSRPDCHDQIEPETVARLTELRIQGEVRELPSDLKINSEVIVYRSYFDRHGFCDLQPLNDARGDSYLNYREAYRRMWLDDLGGLDNSEEGRPQQVQVAKTLKVLPERLEGLDELMGYAEEGKSLIRRLVELIKDDRSPPKALAEVNQRLTQVDRQIEQKGFHHPPLGPVTRMFVFAKENLSGTEALDLASQMERIYGDLQRRGQKLERYLGQIAN